ncbi:ABC transporter family substrate-binding protein [Kitasatospora sp. NPDC052896]|uniref:ABC transporter family substrate-binding protein n=1 Tax=Kitasatospora sp. NPDC052896 TaxID=3364061 RepID=UPI0037C950A6
MSTLSVLRRTFTAAATLGVLAGCTATPPSESPTWSASDLSPGDRAAVRDGGTLRWAVDAVPASLDVFRPTATADDALIAHALLPSLFRVDERGRPTADPDYLDGAEVSGGGQAPQTVTYRLNPKAVWSDGKPLSVEDFAAQWKAQQATHPGYAAIASVGPGAEPHQVKVVFKRPYASWRGLFAPLYPAAGLPASAGPLVLKSLDAKEGRASLVRNPHWWGAPAKVDGIDFLATSDRLEALSKGAVDVAAVEGVIDRPGAAQSADAVDSSARALKRVESLPGITLHRAAAAAFTQLTLNGVRGPLADPAVRRAVAAAVDRRAVAEAALRPLGLPVVPLGNHLLMADQEGYQDNSGALAATAKKLHLGLNLLYPDGSATAHRAAEALVAGLAPAGIAVHPEAAPADSFHDQLAGRDWDLALFSWPAAAFPAEDERAVYAKPRPGVDGRPTNALNYGGTGTEEIDRLFDRAAGEADQKARLKILQQADARIWQLGHSVPLFQRPELVAVRDGVAGVGAYGFGWPRFQDLGFRH